MGGDEDTLALLDLRGDLHLPVGQEAGHGVLQALGLGDVVLGQCLVPGVIAWVPLVTLLHCGWGDICPWSI